jgi:primosomal protein N' (replication factor Y)
VATRRLTLRAQVISSQTTALAKDLPVAQVLVDTGVPHLDQHFDYLIPENYAESAQSGVRVQVPFNNQELEGIIISRQELDQSRKNLKSITKVLSPIPIMSSETISLLMDCAKRWASLPYDIIRSAIPPRIASAERSFATTTEELMLQREAKRGVLAEPKVRAYCALPPHSAVEAELREIIQVRCSLGQVLVILPTVRSLMHLAEELLVHGIPFVNLASDLPRAERYLNYLLFSSGKRQVALGLRGAVFAPMKTNSTLIIYGEQSEHLYEPRTPGWNARDVALLRNEQSLILVGYSPSSEAALLIENSELKLVATKTHVKVLGLAQSHGELLPAGIFPVVRNALTKGPVLALVPRKGYGNALLCNKCRNISRCTCGGRLIVSAKNAVPVCAHCATAFPDWRCAFCSSNEKYIASRGIDRFVEEIGRAFPGVKIINSSGENIFDRVGDEPAIVVATPGAQPRTAGGYSAVVILEGLRFLADSQLRAMENAREIFFSTVAMSAPDTTSVVVLDESNPLIGELNRWSIGRLARAELADRLATKLPPYYRQVLFQGESREILRLSEGFVQMQSDQRLPLEVEIIGPIEKGGGEAALLLTAPLDQSAELIEVVAQVNRRRSVAKKKALSLRIDPYLIS